jgi:hypothetical protein
MEVPRIWRHVETLVRELGMYLRVWSQMREAALESDMQVPLLSLQETI